MIVELNQCRNAENSTLNFYEIHATEYARQTLKVDLAELYPQFLGLLSRNARILDVGCGSGRDLKEFSLRGFKPFGIDASQMLAQFAQDYSGMPTCVTKVEDITFSDQFEGIWACASLLHLPKTSIYGVLIRLRQALSKEGILFVSVQAGNGESVAHDGRFFARYQEAEICEKIQDAGFLIIKKWVTKDLLASRLDISWINILAQNNMT